MSYNSNKIKNFVINQVTHTNITDKVSSHIITEIKHWRKSEWKKVENACFVTRKYNLQKLNLIANQSLTISERIKYRPNTQVIIPTTGKYLYMQRNLQRLIEISSADQLSVRIIFDGVDITNPIISKISKDLSNSKLDYQIVLTPKNLGYKESMYMLLSQLSYHKPQYTVFMDDDAFIIKENHIKVLKQKLEQNNKIEAISGLAVDTMNGSILHDFFNIDSDIKLIQRALEKGVQLDKPHIHGGGGITMMKTNDFIKRLEQSLKNGYLFGPLVSGYARKEKK